MGEEACGYTLSIIDNKICKRKLVRVEQERRDTQSEHGYPKIYQVRHGHVEEHDKCAHAFFQVFESVSHIAANPSIYREALMSFSYLSRIRRNPQNMLNQEAWPSHSQ